MEKKDSLKIEISTSQWKEFTYCCRLGDIVGSTEFSNVTKEEILREISDEMDNLKILWDWDKKASSSTEEKCINCGHEKSAHQLTGFIEDKPTGSCYRNWGTSGCKCKKFISSTKKSKLFPSKEIKGMLTDGQGGYYPNDSISTKKGCGKEIYVGHGVHKNCGEEEDLLCDKCRSSTEGVITRSSGGKAIGLNLTNRVIGCGKDETPNAVLTNVCGETIHDGKIWYCKDCLKLNKPKDI